jgi:hypothetical protein
MKGGTESLHGDVMSRALLNHYAGWMRFDVLALAQWVESRHSALLACDVMLKALQGVKR